MMIKKLKSRKIKDVLFVNYKILTGELPDSNLTILPIS